MSGAVTRYRVMAYVVGVLLLVLVCVAVPMKYGAGDPTLVGIFGPLHGFLYMVYIVVAFDLARRCRWPLPQTILVVLAGTIPFLTFVVERQVVTRWLPGAVETPPEPVELRRTPSRPGQARRAIRPGDAAGRAGRSLRRGDGRARRR